MILLGLTGGIGMGKTTTARLFAAEGAAIYDADAVVHDLYRPGGPAGPLVAGQFPAAVGSRGEVQREALKAVLASDPSKLQDLERIVLPLVEERRTKFIVGARKEGRALAVLDIPLLFETGSEMGVDGVVVVTAPAELQRRRVVTERGMRAETFDLLRARQLTDAERRARADFVVRTDRGLDAAEAAVHEIVAAVTTPGWRDRKSRRLAPSGWPSDMSGRSGGIDEVHRRG